MTELPVSADPALTRLNTMPDGEFDEVLSACLNIRRWVTALRGGRPFPDRAALLRAADHQARLITPSEISGALERHPRIGEQPRGKDVESSWSRREQAGVATTRADTEEALREGNRDYERRFGHIYLVCAGGRSGAEILGDLHQRLHNDPDTESRVVADELRKIALARIHTLLTEESA